MCEARGQTPSTQPPHAEGDGEDAFPFVDLMYEEVVIADPAMVIDGVPRTYSAAEVQQRIRRFRGI